MQPKAPKKITRSTAGLRSVAFEALEQFLNGKVNHDHLKAVNSTITVICATAALDMKAAEQLREMQKTGEMVPVGAPQAVANLKLNIMLDDPIEHDAPAYIPEK